jgi:hypothetical protein
MSISGSWQIVSQNNGPSPECVFDQAGNDFTGLCIGPNARGAITGTITGDQPRWHWQWVTYAGNSSGSFDFMGTLKPNNTITGVILRRGTDLSLNFTAKRQSIASTPSSSASTPSSSSAVQQTNLARRVEKYKPPLTPQQIAHPSNLHEQFLVALSAYDND